MGAAVAVVVAAGGLGGPAAATGGGSSLCVGGTGCYRTVQEAVDAAAPGATVRIAAGTFAGGVRVDKSLRLVGAGMDRTTLKGGGPVLTVGTVDQPPTVTVSGLTVKGGVTTEFLGSDFNAVGGGVLVEANMNAGSGWTTGAAVTLDHVRVTGNRTEPPGTYPSPSGVKCPDGDCPYAGSIGGGIASYGDLVVRDSLVDGNTAGGRASDAIGGGIFSAIGSLLLDGTEVRGNAAAPQANTIGRFAEGGGLFLGGGGSLTVRGSRINGNRSDLVTTWPTRPQGEFLDMNANSEGIHVNDGTASVTVSDSQINDNSVLAEDPNGEPSGIDAAMLVGANPLVMDRTVVLRNTLNVRSAGTGTTGALGSALEINAQAELSDTRVADNSATVMTNDGPAGATGGVVVFNFANQPERVTMTRMTISGNAAVARNSHGSAEVVGAGLVNSGALALRDVTVTGNTGTARGTTATAAGAGIWNGPLILGEVPQPVSLAVWDSKVVANSLSTNPAGGTQGAGIYSTSDLTLTRTVVAGNRPDNCVGCGSSLTSGSGLMGKGSRPGPLHRHGGSASSAEHWRKALGQTLGSR